MTSMATLTSMAAARRGPLPRRVAVLSIHTSPLDQPGTGDAGGMNVHVAKTATRAAKPGGIALYAYEAWRKYFSMVGPIATFGYWFAWSTVLSIFGIVVGSLIGEGTGQAVAGLMDEKRALEKELSRLKSKLAVGQGEDLASHSVDVKGAKVLVATLEDADTVAVAGSPSLGQQVIQRLAWRLEGPRVDLLVAPTIGDVAGPRVTMRMAADLPLLHLDEPYLTGPKRAIKRTLDIVFGVLLLGRYRFGWRGRQALRWTFAGYTLLGLSYFGSKLILENILGKHWG